MRFRVRAVELDLCAAFRNRAYQNLRRAKKAFDKESWNRYSVTQMNVASDKTRKSPQPRIPGLTAAARELGCNRQHLSAVLHGHRISRSLSDRYHALKANQPASPSCR